VKERLVAYQGKLVTVQEQQGSVPNGSGFVITTAAAPDLDATNLVVGRVVGGMDVVEAISQLPSVKANTGSPFFKCGLYPHLQTSMCPALHTEYLVMMPCNNTSRRAWSASEWHENAISC
jgi:hypothetical protein